MAEVFDPEAFWQNLPGRAFADQMNEKIGELPPGSTGAIGRQGCT
jgi:hypothetical protein